MGIVRPEQVMRILEVTDKIGLHRENVTIPLGTQGTGEVTVLEDGKVKIVCPDQGSFEEFLIRVRAELEKLHFPKSH